MKNLLIVLMMILCTSTVFSGLTLLSTDGTSVFPVFNHDRVPWLNHIKYGTPIFVGEYSYLSLTNPRMGLTTYSFRFEVVVGDINFGTPRWTDGIVDIRYPCDNWPIIEGTRKREGRSVWDIPIGIDNIRYPYDNCLILEGIHEGAGSPAWDIPIFGNGIVNIYERKYGNPINPYNFLGRFTVGNPVPESCTLVLLLGGTILLFPNKTK